MGAITNILLLAFTGAATVAATAPTPVSSATPTTTAQVFDALLSDLRHLNPRLKQFTDDLYVVTKNNSIANFNELNFAYVRAGEYYNDAVGDLYDNNITFTTRQARRLITFLTQTLKPTLQREVRAYRAAYPAFQSIGETAEGGLYAYNDATYLNDINSFISVKVPQAQKTAVAEFSSSVSSAYASLTLLYGFTGFPDVPFKRAEPTAA